MFQFQRTFIYFPDRARVPASSVGADAMEIIAVQPADMSESIEGWYQGPSDPSKPVIVYFHGNGLSIPSYYPRVEPFLKAGYGVLLAEYRGFGGGRLYRRIYGDERLVGARTPDGRDET